MLGYGSLVWAQPLDDMGYETLSVLNKDGIVDILPAILSFAKFINVKTPFVAQACLL